MSTSPLRVVARIKAKPDKVGEVHELLRGLVEPTRKEVGCLSYELLQNRKDPTDFTFIEEWESDSAFDDHSATSHIKAVGPKLKEIVAEAPDIRIYSVVA
ncbi:MAG: antibiotic biosynthesis monooxygenase [Acidobacteriota bacterium]|nr:antibiotic biosynthesis monooxygenase [Acidobacteriota bacterium]